MGQLTNLCSYQVETFIWDSNFPLGLQLFGISKEFRFVFLTKTTEHLVISQENKMYGRSKISIYFYSGLKRSIALKFRLFSKYGF